MVDALSYNYLFLRMRFRALSFLNSVKLKAPLTSPISDFQLIISGLTTPTPPPSPTPTKSLAKTGLKRRCTIFCPAGKHLYHAVAKLSIKELDTMSKNNSRKLTLRIRPLRGLTVLLLILDHTMGLID